MDKSPLLRSLDASFRFLRWLGLIALVGVLLSGVRVIGPDEVGLVIRLGHLVGETRAEQVNGPGLLLAAPYLVDRIVRVPVKRVQELRIRELTSSERSDWVDLTRDGYALTGDRAVVQLDVVLRYRISDPVAYALRVRRPRRLIHDVVVGALTRRCARSGVHELLGRGKRRFAQSALADARARLTRLGVGARLDALELRALRPPPQTAAQFQDVQSAFIEQKTRVERAKTYAHQITLMAKARFKKAVLDAKARGEWATAAARGRADAFAKLAAIPARRRGTLRVRLYRERMEKIFGQLGARVIVPAGARARIQLPAAATLLRPHKTPQPPPSPWGRRPPQGER